MLAMFILWSLTATPIFWPPPVDPDLTAIQVQAWLDRRQEGQCDRDGQLVACTVGYQRIWGTDQDHEPTVTLALLQHPQMEPGDVLSYRVRAVRGECRSAVEHFWDAAGCVNGNIYMRCGPTIPDCTTFAERDLCP